MDDYYRHDRADIRSMNRQEFNELVVKVAKYCRAWLDLYDEQRDIRFKPQAPETHPRANYYLSPTIMSRSDAQKLRKYIEASNTWRGPDGQPHRGTYSAADDTIDVSEDEELACPMEDDMENATANTILAQVGARSRRERSVSTATTMTGSEGETPVHEPAEIPSDTPLPVFTMQGKGRARPPPPAYQPKRAQSKTPKRE